MSEDQNLKPTVSESGRMLDRRSMLERSLEIAFGATVLGSLPRSAEAQQRAAAPRADGLAAEAPIRRVVTGHNAEGKSCVISDEMVDARDLWKTSAAEPLGPKRSGEPGFLPSTFRQADPPPGGTWWRLVAFPPSKDPKPTLANRQGFHRTATIDYAYVLSGEVTLLVDVEEVKLNPGDVVVQRNTDHAWRVDGNVPARMLFTLVRVGP